MIRKAQTSDGSAIASIYNHFIWNTIITFEEEPVSDEEMSGRIQKVIAHYCWLVLEEAGEVIGYAYAGTWNPRSAYRHTVESTIYLNHAHTGRGIGTRLMEALLGELKRGKYHCVIAGVALPNEASVRLHEKLGYRKAAHYKEVGYKFGKWIDVGYWQLIF